MLNLVNPVFQRNEALFQGGIQISTTLVLRTGAITPRRIPQISKNFFGTPTALENDAQETAQC